MKNSVSEQSFYIESEEEDVYDKAEDNEAANRSDYSNYEEDSDSENESDRRSKPNSINPSWPQSYRLISVPHMCVCVSKKTWDFLIL